MSKQQDQFPSEPAGDPVVEEAPVAEGRALPEPTGAAPAPDPAASAATDEETPGQPEASDDAILHGDAPVPQEQPAAPPPPTQLDPLRPVTMDDLVLNELQVTIGGQTYWMQPLASFGRAKQARFFALWNRTQELEQAAARGYFEHPNPDPVAAETQPVIRHEVDLDAVDDEIVENQRAILKVCIRGVPQESLQLLLAEQIDELVQRFLALLSVPTRRRGAAVTLLRQAI